MDFVNRCGNPILWSPRCAPGSSWRVRGRVKLSRRCSVGPSSSPYSLRHFSARSRLWMLEARPLSTKHHYLICSTRRHLWLISVRPLPGVHWRSQSPVDYCKGCVHAHTPFDATRLTTMQCLRIWRRHCSCLPRSTPPALPSSRARPDRPVRSCHSRGGTRAFSASQSTHTTQHFKFLAPTESAMSCLASLLAMQLQPGDCYCLEGDVGAGKSVFSREFIREARQDPDLPVPSPTFLLENVYEAAGSVSIHHFDLYRLKGGRDMDRLGIETSLAQAVCLVEWPQRLLDRLPQQYLGVHIQVLDVASDAKQSTPISAHSSHLQHEAATGVLDARAEHLPDDDSCESTSDSMPSLYTDQRPRQVVLAAHGAYWQSRVHLITQLIRQEMTGDNDLDGLVLCSPEVLS